MKSGRSFVAAIESQTETYFMTGTANNSARNPAFDFTKGVLVLIMVLYHWLNYFYSTQGDFYKYLRFLTPSFIFITGFLITHASLQKYSIENPILSQRLILRGLKLIGIFIALNLGINGLLAGSYQGTMPSTHMSIRSALNVYVLGNAFEAGRKAAAFCILVPIGYLLLLSAWLLSAKRAHELVVEITFVLFFLSILALNALGIRIANLELLTIGVLGLLAGCSDIDKIHILSKSPYVYLLGLAYVFYLLAITFWEVFYPLQIIGVCLTLTVIYTFGLRIREAGKIGNKVILLGKYSLFGYIAQVAILQMLHRAIHSVNPDGAGMRLFSFVAAFALTVAIVVAIDRCREKVTAVNWVYTAVFA